MAVVNQNPGLIYYFPNGLYTQSSQHWHYWLPHLPPNCSVWQCIILTSGSAHAVRNVRPLWISWREKREPGAVKTCGYASVIMAMDSWEIPSPKWRFSSLGKQMDNSPLPGLTGGDILMRSFFPLLGCWRYRMVLNLHPLSGWSCEVSRVDAKWLVRQNEHFYQSGGFGLL